MTPKSKWKQHDVQDPRPPFQRHPNSLGRTYRELSPKHNHGTDVDHARLKAASAPHSGDWLRTPAIASLGLKLTDDEVRISVALRLGIRACSPHNCVCGKLVDARGLSAFHAEEAPRDIDATPY